MGRRKCKREGCDTTLSNYNKGEYCYAHTPGVPVYMYTCSKAIGYIPERSMVFTDPYDLKPTVPKPGDEEYNNRLFTKVLIGFINEKGEFEPIEKLIGG